MKATIMDQPGFEKNKFYSVTAKLVVTESPVFGKTVAQMYEATDENGKLVLVHHRFCNTVSEEEYADLENRRQVLRQKFLARLNKGN